MLPDSSLANGVGLDVREERSNKGWPKYFSNPCICKLTAPAVRPTSCAAAAKLPRLKTASSVLRNASFTIFSQPWFNKKSLFLIVARSYDFSATLSA